MALDRNVPQREHKVLDLVLYGVFQIEVGNHNDLVFAGQALLSGEKGVQQQLLDQRTLTGDPP